MNQSAKQIHPTASDPTATAHGALVGHSDEKARQILDGARAIFLRDGFDGASMNDIAKTAGVSKGTLYVYFQSKDELFAALIRHDKRQQAEQLCLWAERRPGEDVRAVLIGLGRRLTAKLMQPEHVAQVRTVMAVSPKFPAIGRAFYETGPNYGTERLAAFFDHLVAGGELAISDTRLAATLFVQMCQGDGLRRMMFCVSDTISEEEIETTVANAVDVFLAAYAAKP